MIWSLEAVPPHLQMLFYSRNCNRNCHAGSFPACHENKPASAGTRLPPLLFFQSQDICLSAPPGGEALPICEERKKEHNNLPVDRFLPYNRGWPSRSTQVLEKRKTQWCQPTQSMAQDIPAALVPFGTVWYCAFTHHHPAVEASCVTGPGWDPSTYLSMQPSVQSQESTNRLEKLLR